MTSKPPTHAEIFRHAEPSDPCGAFVVGPALIERGKTGGPLSGLRFAVKDLYDVAGTRTGAGSPDLLEEAPVAMASAPAVEALVAAGADLWGKTVTDELAFSLSGTNVHYGTPRNPAAPGRVPGGSSAGSASAVACGLVELALGTDTAGSVRVPASYCGLFGLRPTHGRIDDTGVQPLAPSFDTVGLFAGDAARLAAGFIALASGAPARGRAQVRSPRPGVTGRLVVADELMALADPDCAAALEVAAQALAEASKTRLEHASLGGRRVLEEWREGFRAIQLVEVWQTYGAFVTRRRPRLGPGIAARIALAGAADPGAAARARALRDEVGAALADVLGDDGVLVHPAATGPAPLASMEASEKEDLRARILTLTAVAGMAGAPVVVLPLASSKEGLPVGLAIAALPGEDERLLALGLAADGLSGNKAPAWR
jgi:amidase